MSLTTIWSEFEAGMDIVSDIGYAAAEELAAGLGLAPGWFTWAIEPAFFDCQPFTLAEFMRRYPYRSPEVNEARFAPALQDGYLVADGPGRFRASAAGDALARQLAQALSGSIAHLQPLSAEALRRLASHLGRLADASLATPAPPAPAIAAGKRALYRRFGMDEALAGIPATIGQLQGYRDDAYITAWSAHQIEGHAWEALDTIGLYDALTLADLHAKLERRGVAPEVYAEDVQELVRRGWVVEDAGASQDAGAYRATAEGRRIRAEAEASTDRYFFAPWACLSDSALEELAGLASEWRDRLKSSV